MDSRPFVVLPSPVPPPKVEMAFRWVDFCLGIERGCQQHGAAGRALKPVEEATRRAALEVMRTYFSGEHEHLPPFRVLEQPQQPQGHGARYEYTQPPTAPTYPAQDQCAPPEECEPPHDPPPESWNGV